MSIIAYQNDNGLIKFIYEGLNGNLQVCSVVDSIGFDTYLKLSGATKVDKNVDIYEYIAELILAK